MNFDTPTDEIARILVLHFDGAFLPSRRKGCCLNRNAVHVEAVRLMKLRVLSENRVDKIDFVNGVVRRDVGFRGLAEPKARPGIAQGWLASQRR
jgi:hypothetical protein